MRCAHTVSFKQFVLSRTICANPLEPTVYWAIQWSITLVVCSWRPIEYCYEET